MALTELHIDHLASYFDGLGIDPLDLDDLVHDKKLREASTINNGGLYAQLAYLLGHLEVPQAEDVAADLARGLGVDSRLAGMRLR